MPGRNPFKTWESPEPGELIGLAPGWSADLAAQYATPDSGFPGHREPVALRRAFDVAESLGATTAYVETRYIDLDYRSEFSAHFSRAFLPVPSSTHRIHFFAGTPISRRNLLALPESATYLGYVVVAPSIIGRAGRSMLKPPPNGADGQPLAVALALVGDHPHLFGRSLSVAGIPFMEQDAQFGRCAHVVAWMVHYHAHLRHDLTRVPVARFTEWRHGSGKRPSFPSDGLSAGELCEMLGDFDLPTLHEDLTHPWPTWREAKSHPKPPQSVVDLVKHDLNRGPDDVPAMYWDTRIIDYCRRYLDSGIPVIVGKRSHAIVLVGYRNLSPKNPHSVQFVGHDDQRGPYLLIHPPFSDMANPWQDLFVPVPAKLWLPLERAELAGQAMLTWMAEGKVPQLITKQSATGKPIPPALEAAAQAAAEFKALANRGRIWYRTYTIASERYKAAIAKRLTETPASGFDLELGRRYRFMRQSRHLVVVEAVDVSRWAKGDSRCVLGEAIFDSTTRASDPEPLIVHIPGVARLMRGGTEDFPIYCGTDPYRSFAPAVLQ